MASRNFTIKAVLFICWAWFYGGANLLAQDARCTYRDSYDHRCPGTVRLVPGSSPSKYICSVNRNHTVSSPK